MDTQTITPEATATSSAPAGARSAVMTLGAQDQLVGKLVYDGDLRVAGTLEGEATVTGELSVDDGGRVKAKLSAQRLTVRGSVDGDATVRDRLLIAGSGVITGDVKVGRLVIEDGAVLNGNVTMERVSTTGSPVATRPTAAAGNRR